MSEDLGFLKNDPTFPTRAIHKGSEAEQWHSSAVVPPISVATTFKQDEPDNLKKYDYSRSGNPTRECLEKCLASVEDAKYGLTFASGSAATSTIIDLISSRDHIVTMDDIYGGTNRFFRRVVPKRGIEISFVDAVDINNVRDAIRPNTKIIWIETPTNPTLKLVDIAAISALAKEHPNIITVVDNTFMSSYFQRPLNFGADLVMHSLTKYMNGHTDVVMGGICTNRHDLYERLGFLQNAIGPVPSPFDCFLVHRSLKTLHVRMMQHMNNGLAVARFLEKHPCVEKVIHPSLPSHPQHELAKRQSYGHSGMVSFYIKGDDLESSKRFFKQLKVFTLAISLGGHESLIELPSVMTHASLSPEERAKHGITDGLIRLSCGLESAEDLIHDLDQALIAAIFK